MGTMLLLNGSFYYSIICFAQFCALLADLKDHLASKEFTLGYFVPGHSFKGKQIPLIGDEELSKRASQKTRD